MASTNLSMPYPGTGKLVTIGSHGILGRHTPREIFISDSEGQRRLDIQSPSTARWRTTSQLILQTSERTDEGKPDGRIAWYDASGVQHGVIAVGHDMGSIRPAPDGNSVILRKINPNGTLVLHVYPVASPSADNLTVGDPRRIPVRWMREIVWSPDSRSLALGIGVREANGRVITRLHTLDLASGEITRIADSLTDEHEVGGSNPLLWNHDGLFAKTQNRILRCAPDDSGCTLVHQFEDFRVIRGGTTVGGGRAYILVTDVRPDVFEIRANELFEVDLVNGGAKLLLRTPDNVFLDDIDWIAE